MATNEINVNVNSEFKNAKSYEADLERIAKERLEEINELSKAEKLSLEQVAHLKTRLNSSTFKQELDQAKRIHSLKMENARKEKQASVWSRDLAGGLKNNALAKQAGGIASNFSGLQYLANPIVGSIALAGGAIGAGASEGGKALEEYAGYEQATNKTRALAGSSFNAEALTERSMAVASATIFNQKDIVQAVNTLIQGGKTFDEALAMVETVAETAIAHGKTIEESASLLVSTSNQFGISAENASHIADVITRASNTTALSFQDLQDGFKNAGSALSSMGQSVERTTAILGVLGNIGITGAEAGTAVRSILGMASGKQGSKTLAKYGVSMLGEDGKIRSIDLILADFSKALDNSNLREDEKLAEWKKISGEYIGQAREIAKRTSDIEAQTKALEDVAGANKELAGTQMLGLTGLINQIESNWSILKNELGKLLAPLASGALEGIRDGIISAFKWLNEVFKSLTSLFQPFMPSINACLKALTEFSTGVLFACITSILSAVTILSVLFETSNKILASIFDALRKLPVIGNKIGEFVDNNPITIIKKEIERGAKLDKERAEAIKKQATETEATAQQVPEFLGDYNEVEVSNVSDIQEASDSKKEDDLSREERALEDFKRGFDKSVMDYKETGAEELKKQIDDLDKTINGGKALGNNVDADIKKRSELQAKLDEIAQRYLDSETNRGLELASQLYGVSAEELKKTLTGQVDLATKWSGTTASGSSFAQFDWESTGLDEKQLEQQKKNGKILSDIKGIFSKLEKGEVIKL